jgi:hypothetical protein
VFQHSADLSEGFPTTKLGDACETSDECLVATNNTECYGKVCVCKLGFSRFGNLCKPGTFCLTVYIQDIGDVIFFPFSIMAPWPVLLR